MYISWSVFCVRDFVGFLSLSVFSYSVTSFFKNILAKQHSFSSSRSPRVGLGGQMRLSTVFGSVEALK